jgi:hypothetical protein
MRASCGERVGQHASKLRQHGQSASEHDIQHASELRWPASARQSRAAKQRRQETGGLFQRKFDHFLMPRFGRGQEVSLLENDFSLLYLFLAHHHFFI